MDVTPTSNQLADTQTPQHSPVAAPASTGMNFGQMLGTAVNVAGQLASTVGGAQTMGLGPLVGSLTGGLNGSTGTGFGDTSFEDLLLQQEQIQKETTIFNSLTNISKTEHESRMAAIRNFKDG
jgi:hypothetical protein